LKEAMENVEAEENISLLPALRDDVQLAKISAGKLGSSSYQGSGGYNSTGAAAGRAAGSSATLAKGKLAGGGRKQLGQWILVLSSGLCIWLPELWSGSKMIVLIDFCKYILPSKDIQRKIGAILMTTISVQIRWLSATDWELWVSMISGAQKICGLWLMAIVQERRSYFHRSIDMPTEDDCTHARWTTVCDLCGEELFYGTNGDLVEEKEEMKNENKDSWGSKHHLWSSSLFQRRRVWLLHEYYWSWSSGESKSSSNDYWYIDWRSVSVMTDRLRIIFLTTGLICLFAGLVDRNWIESIFIGIGSALIAIAIVER
jgi:hypothetical protein